MIEDVRRIHAEGKSLRLIHFEFLSKTPVKRPGARLLDHVLPDMPLVKYETFGPVSPVIRFKDIDDAIRIANSTDYGLSSSVCTPSGR